MKKPKLQWLVSNARTLSIKNFTLTDSREVVKFLSIEVYAVHEDGSSELVLVGNEWAASFCPTWTFCGLKSTAALSSSMHARSLDVRIRSGREAVLVQERVDLDHLIQLNAAQGLPSICFPPNFLLLDMGGVACTSERQLHALQTRNAVIVNLPSLFTVREEEDPLVLSAADGAVLQEKLDRVERGVGSGKEKKKKRLSLSLLMQLEKRIVSERARCEEQRKAQGEAREGVLRSRERLSLYSEQRKAQRELCEKSLKSIREKKKLLARLKFLLEARQSKLLSDLLQVYHLSESPAGVLCIKGLEMPGELGLVKDDDHVNSALGYLVHALLLASKYLEVPLRYQLLFMGSRSLIRDPVLLGHENTFPLFRRSTERERFERGLQWLRGDMEQLLASRGLMYDPFKSLLQNFNTLFECELCPNLSI